MKFQLNGMQRDLVTSYAIHQDGPALIAFIEELVNEYAVPKPEVPSGKADDGGTQAPAKK